jgi:hypothetical protein
MIDLILFSLSSSLIFSVYFFLLPRSLRENFLFDIFLIKSELEDLVRVGALSMDVKAVANLKNNLDYFSENESTVRLAYYVAMHYIIKNSPAFKEYLNSLPKQEDPPIEMQPIINALREKMLRIVANYSLWSSPILGITLAIGALVSANWSRFWSWSRSAPEKMSESISHLRALNLLNRNPVKAH